MFVKGDTLYSEAGKLLVSEKFCGYQCSADRISEMHEEDITLEDMKLVGNKLIYSGGKIKQKFYPEYTRNDWKTAIIKTRYSNDDQLAIILNKEESGEGLMLYKKMQDWRTWASKLADKISTLK